MPLIFPATIPFCRFIRRHDKTRANHELLVDSYALQNYAGSSDKDSVPNIDEAVPCCRLRGQHHPPAQANGTLPGTNLTIGQQFNSRPRGRGPNRRLSHQRPKGLLILVSPM